MVLGASEEVFEEVVLKVSESLRSNKHKMGMHSRVIRDYFILQLLM